MPSPLSAGSMVHLASLSSTRLIRGLWERLKNMPLLVRMVLNSEAPVWALATPGQKGARRV
jgi:hypothetical protein